MWRRSKKIEKPEGLHDLILPSPEGAPWAAFPPIVVDPIRRFISRLESKEAIPTRLSFVAALRREGVSYISWAFATTLAHDFETSVCIVDLNWWWPSEFIAKIRGSRGLGPVFTEKTPLERAIVQAGKPNLAILPAGELPLAERAHFARSEVLKEILMELNARYDHLILDIPAVLAANDAIPLASLGTACCLVIYQGVTSIDEVKSALSDLEHIPNLGVVMNRYRLATPRFVQKFVCPSSYA